MTGTGEDRPLRADAVRNREALLEAAAGMFAGDADVTLEAIAGEAGVGIGTLYRHFPTREALVEASYRDELGRLCAAAGELLAELPPDRALRDWMDRFTEYMTSRHGMPDALRAVVAPGDDPFPESRDLMVGALTSLLAAGAAAGTVRSDVEPGDVLTALSGVTLAVGPDGYEQAGPSLDLLLDGLRPR